ncbi:unnamed protein product [Symbiodinium sp. CCMP2592]|nr:unnamed protein product [Symbiodinium sp. CCMP2592]
MAKPAYILQDEAELLDVSPFKPSITQPGASGNSPAAPVSTETPSPNKAGGENAVLALTAAVLIQCKICLEMLAKHCFGKGKNSQCVCLECRRADEAAEKQVKGTAEEAQWKQLKAAGGADYRKVIIDFRKKCPAKGRGAQRAKYDFTTMFKTLETFNQVQTEARCRWMTETYYLEWSQTAEGGSYTPMEAKDRWDNLYNDIAVGRDKLGKGGADRLLIHMFDEVVGSSGTRSSKGITQSGRTQKDISEDKLQDMCDAMGTGHDGFSSEIFSNVNGGNLSAALRAGGSSLGRGRGGALCTQAALPPPPPADGAAEENKKKKRKTDVQALKVTQHDRLQRENQALVTEARDVLWKLDSALESVTPEDEELYKMYVNLLRTRRSAIEVWAGPLDEDPDDPADAISAFKEFKTDACLPENRAMLPSPDFEHLLSRFEIASEAFDNTTNAADQDELKQTLKSFGERKALVKNLLSCGMRAVKDLKSARAARQKTFETRVKKEAAQAKAAAKAKAKEEARASGARKPPKGAQAETANAASETAEALPPIFQFGTLTDLSEAVTHLKAQAVPTAGSAGFSSTAADVTKPFLVESCSELEDSLSKDDMVRQRFNFLRTFQSSPQFTGSGRGTMNLPDMSGLLGTILKYAPAEAVDPVRASLSDQELATLVTTVGAYAFSDVMRYAGTEFKQAATLRFQLKGKRRFAAVGFAALQEKLITLQDDSATTGVAAKMSELNVSKAQDISVEVASQVLQAATTTDADGLMPMFYIGESGANSVTYVPAGFFMLDITYGKQMVSGFRASLLVATPSEVDNLKAIIQTFEAAGRDAGLMVSMVNAMKNHDALITVAHAGVKKEEAEEDEGKGDGEPKHEAEGSEILDPDNQDEEETDSQAAEKALQQLETEAAEAKIKTPETKEGEAELPTGTGSLTSPMEVNPNPDTDGAGPMPAMGDDVKETPTKRPRLLLDSPKIKPAAPVAAAPSKSPANEMKQPVVGESQKGNEAFLNMMKAKSASASAAEPKDAAKKAGKK